MSEYQDFATRLKLHRKIKGLTQANAAKQLEISQSSLAMLESGNRAPSIEVVSKLLTFYNTTYEELFLGIKPKEPEIDLKYVKALEKINELTEEKIKLQERIISYETQEKEKAQEKVKKL